MAFSCPYCDDEFQSKAARAGHVGGAHAGGGNPEWVARRVDREDLLEELRRLGEDLGKRPSCGDMKEHGRYSFKPYMREFGGWNDAIEAAGWDPYERGENPSDNYWYGSGWGPVREKVIDRDGGECRACGLSREEHRERTGQDLDVHHVEKRAEFDVESEADVPENLVTVCKFCHQSVEGDPSVLTPPKAT